MEEALFFFLPLLHSRRQLPNINPISPISLISLIRLINAHGPVWPRDACNGLAARMDCDRRATPKQNGDRQRFWVVETIVRHQQQSADRFCSIKYVRVVD